MGRTLPRYLLRDSVTIYHIVDEGSEGRTFDDGRVYRCHFEGTANLRSADGRRRHPGGANVWIPMPRKTRRRVSVRTRDLDVGALQVGDRVGSGRVPLPGPSTVLPLELSVELEYTDQVVNEQDYFFDVEDRVVNNRTGRVYQIVEVDEWEGPRGPDHMRLKLRDQRGG